tara:strand:- start:7611 stop:7766 length:156 start_codon:yes stop_codon:yes gene_type:complete
MRALRYKEQRNIHGGLSLTDIRKSLTKFIQWVKDSDKQTKQRWLIQLTPAV